MITLHETKSGKWVTECGKFYGVTLLQEVKIYRTCDHYYIGCSPIYRNQIYHTPITVFPIFHLAYLGSENNLGEAIEILHRGQVNPKDIESITSL